MSTTTPLVAGFEEDRPGTHAPATAAQQEAGVLLRRQASAIPPPLSRSTVGAVRLAARDEWNAQELRISEAFARGVRHASQALDESRFRVLVTALIGHAPSDVDFKRIMRMADRDLDGQVDFEECQYGLRSWHGYHCISSDSLRSFAELHFGGSEGIDTGKLSALMQDLNGGLVDSTEVGMVVNEAEFLSGGEARRPELIRAVGAWYAHVMRTPTPWVKLFATGACRYLPAVEYHTAVLAWVAYANDNLLHSPESASTTVTFQSQGRARLGGVAHVCYMWLILAIYAASFLALVLPSAFFVWLIYVGSEHGSDACPRDLDGLLVWYGALGLATVVVSCADSSAGPASSTIVLALNVVLLLLPWLGTSWTMHLNWVDRQACGQFLSEVSIWLWVLITFLELGLALLASVGVFVNVRLERKLVADAKM